MREALSYISWVINIHLRNCMKFIKFSVSSLRLSFTIIGTKNWCMRRNMHHYCKDSHLIFIFILHSVTHKDFPFFLFLKFEEICRKVSDTPQFYHWAWQFPNSKAETGGFHKPANLTSTEPGKRSDRVSPEVNSHWQCDELEFK